ncbi:uncharacterized protein EI90DRAFT_3015727 [Cantharellus anzutake]|uniref:uncharacterized protein n=1 Tax=Cantharellus anzutake TaxID=1750568 RepID=UPI0019086379|nr:uncharacterized protein EI90DRAFT_3015727 [Cantharellus anzutake]KAF8332677.1 hypothetical protein EI90DRAFT_3015727 [Cantharellus anzutake]
MLARCVKGIWTSVNIRRRKGKLRRLVDNIPLELITEICCFLDPQSLMSLARTAKIFARLLLKPERSWVWRVSRESYVPNLPPIHEDLTEQQYAVLAFGNACQSCGTTTTCFKVSWRLRRRWCRRCYNQLPQHSGFCDVWIHREEVEIAERHEGCSRLILHQDTINPKILGRIFEGWPAPGHRPRTICPVDELEGLKIKLNKLSDVEWETFVSTRLAERKVLEMGTVSQTRVFHIPRKHSDNADKGGFLMMMSLICYPPDA